MVNVLMVFVSMEIFKILRLDDSCNIYSRTGNRFISHDLIRVVRPRYS
ncbi:hypothetical protein DSUL_30071 [Desulfovibrionales bacterium]